MTISRIKQIFIKQGVRKYSENTFWRILERISRIFTTFIVGILVVRYLGPEQYGALSYCISFVGLFITIASLGLDSIVVRELVKSPQLKNKILGTAFTLKVAGAIIMLVLLVAATVISKNDLLTNTMIIVIGLAALFQSVNVIDFLYQAEVQSKRVVYAQVTQLVVSSFVKLWLVYQSAPLIWFAIAYTFDAAILALSLLAVFVLNGREIRSCRWEKEVAKKLLIHCWPLILSGTIVSIYLRVDQVMIKEILGVKQVGYYSVAAYISTIWYFIPIIITSSLFPALLNAKKNSRELYFSRLQLLYDLLFWIAIIITIPVYVYSDEIIHILYGKEYLAAGPVLSIAIFASVFTNIGLVNNRYFTAEKRTKDIMYRSLLGLAINIILNSVLIRRYGIEGAAIATVAAQFSTSIMYTGLRKDSRILYHMALRSVNLKRCYNNLNKSNLLGPL